MSSLNSFHILASLHYDVAAIMFRQKDSVFREICCARLVP